MPKIRTFDLLERVQFESDEAVVLEAGTDEYIQEF